jgi:hypothetical protein
MNTSEERKPAWQDVIFDITSPKERREHLSDGGPLPMTFEVSPIEHAEMCTALRDGLLDKCWSAFVRVPIAFDANGCPELEFTTIDEARRMMQLAAEHATKPQALTQKPSVSTKRPTKRGAR